MLPPRFRDLDDLNHHLDREGLDDDLDILGEDDLETLKIPIVPAEPPASPIPRRGRKPPKKKSS